MFGFWKRRKNDEPPAEYSGEGIWVVCPDCGNRHEIDEDPDFRQLLERLCGEIGQSSQEIYGEFGIGSSEGRWDVLPEEPLFKFTDGNGRTAVAPYGIVASWNPDTDSWLWAWAFPEDWVPAPARTVAERLRKVGEEEGWEAATSRELAVNEHEAWHLTELAAHIAGYPLVYRARVNEQNWHYYAIDRLRWTN